MPSSAPSRVTVPKVELSVRNTALRVPSFRRSHDRPSRPRHGNAGKCGPTPGSRHRPGLSDGMLSCSPLASFSAGGSDGSRFGRPGARLLHAIGERPALSPLHRPVPHRARDSSQGVAPFRSRCPWAAVQSYVADSEPRLHYVPAPPPPPPCCDVEAGAGYSSTRCAPMLQSIVLERIALLRITPPH